MTQKKKNSLSKILAIPVGIIMLALAIILEKFVPQSGILDFFIGMLVGMSIVFNIYYIYIKARRS